MSENSLFDAFRTTLWALFVLGACFVNSTASGLEQPESWLTAATSESVSLTIPKVHEDGNAQKAALEVAQVSSAPTITSLSPSSGPIGTTVTILGSRFTAANFIRLRGTKVVFDSGSPVASEGGAMLQFQVNPCSSSQPQCPTFYVPPGEYTAVVANENGTSNGARFVITPF
jgi:hypothetical protein